MLSLLKHKLFSLVVAIAYLQSACLASDLLKESANELKSFKYCMRQTPQLGLQGCAGRSALNFIQRFDEQDNFTFIEDFVVTKNDNVAARSLVNLLDTDPVDFRGILEGAGAVMGQRSLEWHMDKIYPGLMFKIGPTADANSVAEFIVDPNAIGQRQFGYEEPSTARVLTQQYLLPFLLGLKFNLVALVPLLFAGICLLLKKSLFFAKLAIYVSSFLGIGGAIGAISSLGAGGAGGGGFSGLFGAPIPPLAGGYHPPIGQFPGKTTVYGHYDELSHNDLQQQQQQQIYKRRADRKFKFEEPATTAAPTTAARDHFYDYERGVLKQQHTGKLGPSAAYEDEVSVPISVGGSQVHNFREKDARSGWQVVDMLV